MWAFELFLLLHCMKLHTEDDIWAQIREQIIRDEKIGHGKTFIYKLLPARTGINPEEFPTQLENLAKNTIEDCY